MSVCSPPFDVPISEITAVLDCCTLTFRNSSTGEVYFTFNLENIAIVNSDGAVIMRDGISYLSLGDADFAALGLTVNQIIRQADLCRCGVTSQVGMDPVLFCTVVDENCNITGAQAIIFDEVTQSYTTIYFDAQFQVTTTPPDGDPCDSVCARDFEFKVLENCYEDANNIKYKQIVCITFLNGIKESETISWLLPDGTVSDTMPPGISPCDIDCTPLIQEFDLSEGVTSFIDFTNITIYTEGCCMVTVNTSAGVFRVRPNTKVFSSSQFACPIVLNDITLSGDCNPQSVVVYLENKGCSSCTV